MKLLDVQDIEEVLLRLNPIQMLERRIEQSQTVDEALLNDYANLIALISASSEDSEGKLAGLVKKMSEASAKLYQPL
jgi:hypothetical protein